MFKKFLFVALGAATLCSCNKSDSPDPAVEEDEKATLVFDVDWSALDETPSGLTLVFYPTDPDPIDTIIRIRHFNVVDHISLTLPDQDYSVTCFNQSETEFANLEFGFPSFEEAYVRATDDGESAKQVLRYASDDTRAINKRSTLKAGSFATTSKAALKASKSKSYTTSTVLRPTCPIKVLSLDVYVFGLNNGVKVSGSLSNLSAGVRLHNQEPLDELLDQELGEEAWSITESDNDSLPSRVTCTFGTFGVPVPGASFPTRAAQSVSANILTMEFELPDGDTVVFRKDVTEVVQDEYARLLEAEEQGDTDSATDSLHVQVGNPEDMGGSNTSGDDGVTDDGSLILHHTTTGVNVSVSGWGNNVININL